MYLMPALFLKWDILFSDLTSKKTANSDTQDYTRPLFPPIGLAGIIFDKPLSHKGKMQQGRAASAAPFKSAAHKALLSFCLRLREVPL